LTNKIRNPFENTYRKGKGRGKWWGGYDGTDSLRLSLCCSHSHQKFLSGTSI
jgi:hypothetical protein